MNTVGHPHFLSGVPFSPCPCSRDGQWDRAACSCFSRVTEWLRLEGTLEITWAKHSPKQGHQESPVKTMSRQLLGISKHRDSTTSVPNTGVFSSDPSSGSKSKAGGIWGLSLSWEVFSLPSPTIQHQVGRLWLILQVFPPPPKLKAVELLRLLLP